MLYVALLWFTSDLCCKHRNIVLHHFLSNVLQFGTFTTQASDALHFQDASDFYSAKNLSQHKMAQKHHICLIMAPFAIFRLVMCHTSAGRQAFVPQNNFEGG